MTILMWSEKVLICSLLLLIAASIFLIPSSYAQYTCDFHYPPNVSFPATVVVSQHFDITVTIIGANCGLQAYTYLGVYVKDLNSGKIIAEGNRVSSDSTVSVFSVGLSAPSAPGVWKLGVVEWLGALGNGAMFVYSTRETDIQIQVVGGTIVPENIDPLIPLGIAAILIGVYSRRRTRAQ